MTFAGCGSAVLAAGFPALGIGFLGVSLAFGLTVLTMAYAVGHISGGHFNCAVTIGLWAGGRFKASDVIPYIIAQVAGAIVAAAVLYAIASGKPDWVAGGFASNGFGDLSPGKYGLMSCFFIEVIATFFFLYVIIGTTSKGAAVGFAGIPIGLCLTLIHLFLISQTRLSIRRVVLAPRCSPAVHISASSGFSGLRRAWARLLQDSSGGGSTIRLTPHRRDASRTTTRRR